MREKLVLILGGVLLVGQVSVAQAATTTTNFFVSASIPAASAVTMTVSKVTVNTAGTVTSFVAQPAGTTALPFGQLVLNSTLGIYQDGVPGSVYYWAIDLTPNGAGVAQPTVSYTETTTLPAGQTQGLGYRAHIQFAKVVYVTTSSSTETPISGQHYTLAALGGGVTVPSSSALGGWMRLDIALCSGNANSANGAVDPAGCAPFTAADRPATYSGTLGVTAVIN